MAEEFYPQGRQDKIVIQELKNEVLIYDLVSQKAVCLNQTAALVWQFSDGLKSVGEISEILSEKLNSEVNQDLVWLALDHLRKENLIVNSGELHDNFKGMSRRQLIKNVGLGTMMAIPVVTGLVAPGAATAASCYVDGTIVGNEIVHTNCDITSQITLTAVCQNKYGKLCCSGQAEFVYGSVGPAQPCVFPCECATY